MYQSRALPSVFLGSLVVGTVIASSPGLGDACLSATDVTGDACAAEVRRSFVDATRAFELSSEQSAGNPWILQAAPPSAPAPVAVSPTDAGVSARASLGQWRDYDAQMTAKKMEAAKAIAPHVAARAASSPLDLWSNIDVQGLDGVASETRRVGVGADYKLNKSATVGVVAERGESHVDGAVSDDSKLAAYMAFRVAPAVTIDARTEWQAVHTPGDHASESGAVSVAPRVAKPFALDGGASIEPFVTYKQAFDLGGATDEAAAAPSAGAGVTYAKPESYSFSVTTDLENLGAAAPASVNSKLQLKVPIP